MSNTTTGTSKYFNTRHVEECILLIDAEAHDSSRILEHLGPAQDHSFQVEWVNHLSAGIDRLRRGGVGAVLLDLSLPESDGLHALDKILQAAPTIPVLVLADTHTEQLARLAVHHGAQDYFIKNHADGYRLRLAVRSMMERQTVDAILSENEAATLPWIPLAKLYSASTSISTSPTSIALPKK
jgi:sigma-B regulation protein RsbU (phosphoserine phosphatase)